MDKIQEWAKANDVTISSVFVPWSVSRGYKPKPRLRDLSLNWKVTVFQGKRKIIETDYGAGVGHCPSYKYKTNYTVFEFDRLMHECERGRDQFNKPIMPDLSSVLHSLVIGASVLDYGSFEDWATEFGYDPDSRTAHKIYQECLAEGLRLRVGFGEEKLRELLEICYDY